MVPNLFQHGCPHTSEEKKGKKKKREGKKKTIEKKDKKLKQVKCYCHWGLIPESPP
jgi:hypothetical protein